MLIKFHHAVSVFTENDFVRCLGSGQRGVNAPHENMPFNILGEEKL